MVTINNSSCYSLHPLIQERRSMEDILDLLSSETCGSICVCVSTRSVLVVLNFKLLLEMVNSLPF